MDEIHDSVLVSSSFFLVGEVRGSRFAFAVRGGGGGGG